MLELAELERFKVVMTDSSLDKWSLSRRWDLRKVGCDPQIERLVFCYALYVRLVRRKQLGEVGFKKIDQRRVDNDASGPSQIHQTGRKVEWTPRIVKSLAARGQLCCRPARNAYTKVLGYREVDRDRIVRTEIREGCHEPKSCCRHIVHDNSDVLGRAR